MNRRCVFLLAVPVSLILSTTWARADLAPGLRMRVYEIGEDMDRLFALKPDQTPNYEKVLSNINLKDAEAFGGLSEKFRANVTAIIRVTKPGSYGFRLTADDGAKLAFSGRMIERVLAAAPFPPLKSVAVGEQGAE